MSTKCTIAYSSDPETDFHFYHECFDDENVYLELSVPDLDFHATPDGVVVRIPLEIWETIRRTEPVDLEFAGLTDGGLQERAEEYVNERIASYEQLIAEGEDEAKARILSAWGGPALTRDEQVQEMLEIYRGRREFDTALKNKIDKVLEQNKKYVYFDE